MPQRKVPSANENPLPSRWAGFRATKTYDLLVTIPLILWYALALKDKLPLLSHRSAQLFSSTISLSEFLQLTALLSSAILALLLIYLLIMRTTPLLKSAGILPRITAIMGTFAGNSILLLPVAPLSLTHQALSNILIFGGTLLALTVLIRLGKAFAIMPEARNLVTTGPYAVVRHPLYTVEAIIFLGSALQFQQPWALLIWLLILVLQYCRSVFEEQVLESKYPQYTTYRARTWRFIPGVF